MILSVLIPTYNYDCSKLVRDLSRQLPADAEIIVGDDGSTDPRGMEMLEGLTDIPQLRLWRAGTNLGRAAIRNRLAGMAQGEWLLFLDSDAEVCNREFIPTYLKHREADVVCGGTASPSVCPSQEVSLRFLYESRYWKERSADVRQQSPFASFTTFNFMIRREVFLGVRFRENCKRYGHEDTLFGKDLERQGGTIVHINNPMVHIGLEPNERFLEKTEDGLRSLKEMRDLLSDGSRLLSTVSKLERWHMTWSVRLFHAVFGKLIRRNLCSTHPILRLFSVYKLGYYLSL